MLIFNCILFNVFNISAKAQYALHLIAIPVQTIWEHPRCRQTVFTVSWSRWPLPSTVLDEAPRVS